MACWIEAAKFDTISMLFTSRINSCFWAWDTEQAIPDIIQTLRIYFSPKEFLISKREPFSRVMMVKGRWVCTDISSCNASPGWYPWSCSVLDCRQWEQWPVPFCCPILCHLDSLCLSKEMEFYMDVIEDALRGASGTRHNNCESLESDNNIFWDVNSLIAENALHPRSRCGKNNIYS